VSFALIAPIGPLFVERRLHAIDAQARLMDEGAIPQALAQLINDPVIGMALAVMIAWLLGIVFLMTNKPSSIAEAILIMLVALIVGLVIGAPLWWRRGNAVASETN
jgi:hypothetical protein